MQRIPNEAAVSPIQHEWRFSLELKTPQSIALVKHGMEVSDMRVRHRNSRYVRYDGRIAAVFFDGCLVPLFVYQVSACIEET
jgi:hypothetical protein